MPFCNDKPLFVVNTGMRCITNLLIGVGLLVVTASACHKTSALRGLPGAGSIYGDWVLRYADTAGIRSFYPGDHVNTVDGGGLYPSWASHLELFTNDSAHWVNCGVDATPMMQVTGKFTLLPDSIGSGTILFDFKPGGWGPGNISGFTYSFKTIDTLRLKNPVINGTLYSYSRN